MNVFRDIIGIEDGCNENGKQLYSFDFTKDQITAIKSALYFADLLKTESGIQLYKTLCESVSNDMDKVILSKYE